MTVELFPSDFLDTSEALRKLAASINTGGGVSLTVTDGTHTVNAAGMITVSGATVGGTSPNATLAISGGITGTRGLPATFDSANALAQAATANCPIYYLSEWIVGDGSADDTAALNAAFALAAGVSTGATFILNGICNISDTIVIGDNTGSDAAPTSFINLICTGGAGAAPFRWSGPSDGRPAILFARNKYFYVRGLGLQNNGEVGSSVGLLLGGSGGTDSGTATLAAVFDKCSVSGFNTGIIDGNYGGSSEILWNSLSLYNCNTGWVSDDFNTLNHVFVMLQMGGCGVGLDSGAGEGFHVYGGSSSQSSICDFNVQSNGACDVTSFRNENSVGFVRGQGGSILLKNCNQKASVLAGDFNAAVPGGVSVSGVFDRLVIDNCQLDGWVSLGALGGANSIAITNSFVQVDPNNNMPISLQSSDFGTITRLFLKHNESIQSNHINTNDFDGFVTGGGFNAPTQTTLLSSVIKKVQQDQTPIINSGQTYGADTLAMGYVRHLGEGPLPGITTASVQSETTSAATLAGSNILTVSAVPSWLTPGMIVTDATAPGALPYSTSVDHFSATEIFLTANVVSPGVGSGDTLNFYTSYGVSYSGNNLRVSGTFGSSGTLDFTFTRDVTVNTGTGQNNVLVAVSGIFMPTDVGKPIAIAGHGNQAWTDWYGYGVKYIDATNLLVQPAGGQATPYVPSGVGNATAVIGQNEPDANYIVASIVGNAAAPETYSITAQTASGFTVASSNASSTATVTFLLIR
jgi:hypothetical protein